MNALLVPLLVLLLQGGVSTGNEPVPTLYQFCSRNPIACEYMARSAWADTCRLSVYVCSDVQPPRFVLMPLDDRLNGMHVHGLDAVFVDADLAADWYTYSVIAHEMTHYLQAATGAALTRCEKEAEAFAITNLVLAERGRQDLRRNNWRQLYGC